MTWIDPAGLAVADQMIADLKHEVRRLVTTYRRLIDGGTPPERATVALTKLLQDKNVMTKNVESIAAVALAQLATRDEVESL